MELYRWERIPPKRLNCSLKDYKNEGKLRPVTKGILSLFENYFDTDDEDDYDGNEDACELSITTNASTGSCDRPIQASVHYKAIAETDFKRDCLSMESDSLWVVHFHDSSRNCSIVNSVIEDLACKYNSVVFRRLQGSSCRGTAKGMAIARFPSIVIMKNGKLRDRLNHFGESDYFTIEGESRMLRAWIQNAIEKNKHI